MSYLLILFQGPVIHRMNLKGSYSGPEVMLGL